MGAVFLIAGCTGPFVWQTESEADRSAGSPPIPSPYAQRRNDRVRGPSRPGRVYRPINEYVLEQTNAERQRGRLSPLRHDPTLSQIACGHNRDMLKHDYMGHQDSDGHSPSDRVRWQHRRLLGEVSENTYREDSLSGPDSHEDNQRWATRIVERWMQSAPHRKNILGTNWTHVGACVMRDAATGRATQVLANVHAYLARPLPQRLPPGDSVFVSFRTVGTADWPTRYLFAPAEAPRPSASPSATGGRPLEETLHLPDSTGAYVLRVLTPSRRGAPSIVEGPRVLVERDASSQRAEEGPRGR